MTHVNGTGSGLCYLPGIMAKQRIPTSDPTAIQQDTDKLVRFLAMYCQAHHHGRSKRYFTFVYDRLNAKVLNGPELCGTCERLLRHAIVMRERCPLDPKPRCRRCPRHCYRLEYRGQMEEVMKFSGPRSLLGKG